jgi:hypothetical protein
MKVAWGVAVGLVITLAGCGGHASAPTTTTTTITVTQPRWTASTTPSSSVNPPPPPVEYVTGQWVDDGALAFNVDFGYAVNGEAMVFMWVENVSSVPQTYVTGLQSLPDDQGRVFAPDYGAKVDDDPSIRISRVDLNPGVTIKVDVTFTVAPKTDTSQYRLLVRGGPGSPGTAIRLVKPGAS